MTKPTDEELDNFIQGYLSDGEDWWYDEEIDKIKYNIIKDIINGDLEEQGCEVGHFPNRHKGTTQVPFEVL